MGRSLSELSKPASRRPRRSVPAFCWLNKKFKGSRAPGKSPRPIGRIAMRRRELVNRSGEEMTLPLKVVSKFPDVSVSSLFELFPFQVQGQICLDLRRESGRFSLR